MEVKEEKAEIRGALTHKGVTWVNLEKPTHDEVTILSQHFPFHRLNLEDCLSRSQLTKIDEHEDYMFIVLHFPVLVKETGIIQSSQLSIFLGKNYIVTVHQGQLRPLVEMFQACRNEPNERQAMMGKGSSYLLYSIIDRLVDAIFPILDRVMGDLDEVEDRVFDERVESIHEVTRLRRQIADLRRITFALKGVVVKMAMRTRVFSEIDLSPYFSDIEDHIGKVWETLEECKETIEIYKDTEHMLNVERSNKILAVLTIVFTLSIPITVVGTLYGMNVNLPGGIGTGDWNFLGTYTTFLVIMIASAVSALAMVLLFRRSGWI